MGDHKERIAGPCRDRQAHPATSQGWMQGDALWRMCGTGCLGMPAMTAVLVMEGLVPVCGVLAQVSQ